MEAEIIRAYRDNPVSATKLYQILGKKYKLKDIKAVLANVDIKQQSGKTNPFAKEYNPIVAPEGTYQMDLTFFPSTYKPNILLNIIEI